MKKMSNKKKRDILETALGLWTGICFGGWLCEAIEGNDTLAMLFLVAALVGMAVCFGITAVIDAKWQKEQKKQADREIMFGDWIENTMLKEK